MTTQIRLYLEIAAVLVLLVAFGAYTIHERHKGEQIIEASDSKATAAAKALAEAQTKHLADLSTQAQQAAQHEQNAIDAYSLAHPVGVIRLCNQNNSGPSLPKGSPFISGTPSPSPGPDSIPAVPASPDIGPALGELMLDAARLATIDREWQQR